MSTQRILYLALFLLILFSLLQLGGGTIEIDWKQLGPASRDELSYQVFWYIRLPKLIAALLSGALLSFSGLLLQTYFKNPLADPSVLGISSAAGLGAATWIMSSASLPLLMYFPQELGLSLSACIFAFLSLLLLIFFSSFLRNKSSLLVSGILLSSFSSALVLYLQFQSGKEELQRYILWTMGDLTAIGWSELMILLGIGLFGVLYLFLQSQPMNILLMGSVEAKNLGISTQKLQIQILISTSVLSALIMSFCGPIGFVGMAIPHLSRMLFRTYKHQILIPASLILGALFLVICQYIADHLIAGKSIPVNMISAFLGAPLVLWFLYKKGLDY